MAKNKLKEIRAHIPDSNVWDSFLGHIKNVHGKTHGYIGIEVQNALKQYIENYSKQDVNELEERYQKEREEIRKEYEVKIQSLEQSLQVSKTLVEEIKPLKKMNQEYDLKIQSLSKENVILLTETKVLHKAQEDYNELHKEYLKLQNSNDKLRNNYDHLQARFNKSQKELNSLERNIIDLRVIVAKIQKMSFLERVLNRLPSEVKQLTSNDNVLSKKE